MKSSSGNIARVFWVTVHLEQPARFPMGCVGTSVASLATEICRTPNPVASSQLICKQCEYYEPQRSDRLAYIVHADRYTIGSTSRWIRTLEHEQQSRCPVCLAEMEQPIFYNEPPSLLVLEYSGKNVKTSHKLIIEHDKGFIDLYLRGIVYLGGFHFTCRIFSEGGDIYYHDGRETGVTCINDGQLKTMQYSSLQTCKNRGLILAVYARV